MLLLIQLLIALILPWFTFLFTDRPGAALIALGLQVTLIGWIPASIWAMKTVFDDRKIKQQAAQDALEAEEDEEEEE